MVAGFAVSLALSAGAALADGMDRKGGASCCAPTWTGLYIGAGVGGGAVVHALDFGPATFDGIGGEGVFGTVILGYDKQVDARWVLGIFADYDFSAISTDLVFVDADHTHSWGIGARAGFLSSPTTLWYGTAGYTEARFELNGLGSQTFHGYFLGAGVESQLGGNWSLRGEYRFTQFEGEDIGFGLEVEPSMHTGRLSLTYKFGDRRDAHRPLK
jgi:outer membrane immunogenic protein